MKKTFNFKNNYNVNVSMSVENYNNENIDPLIDFVKEFDGCIYWNDLECYHWMFDKKIDKIVLAKAAQLGMKYQEEKIKQGIQIVFNELNK